LRTYRLYQVDAFTTEKFAGNPAGVVPNADGLSAADMQAIAREMNNSETAFILAPESPDHEVRVRFFTPTTEVPSCGHATIAAHYVRAVEESLDSCTVFHKIGAGVLPVGVVRDGDDYAIEMTQVRPEFAEPCGDADRDEMIAALGLALSDRDERCPVQIVSTGHSKVMVGLHALETLHALRPDLPRLAALSSRIGCNGYYAFVLTGGDEYLVHGRMFAPAIGIAEDPATGNANGPLGAYLIRHRLAAPDGGVLSFRARQGEALGRPGTIEVSVEAEETTPTVVRVAGRAVVVFQAEIAV
jgi:PhzF family phenazine biosynthesis protein